jgi:hypothetical protein
MFSYVFLIYVDFLVPTYSRFILMAAYQGCSLDISHRSQSRTRPLGFRQVGDHTHVVQVIHRQTIGAVER